MTPNFATLKPIDSLPDFANLKPVSTQPENLKSTSSSDINSPGISFPSTGNESILGGILTTIGNIPSSAVNFVKGAVNFLNPVNTVKTIAQIPSEFQSLVQETGGITNALGATAKEILPTAYGQLVPKATQQIISGDFQGARQTLQEDPVGQILPYLLAGKAAAEKAGVGTQFDNAVSKIASPVTTPAEIGGGIAKNLIEKSTKFGISQATGLSPDTITKVISDPQAFTKEAQATLDRTSLANEVKTALDTKKATLQETGAGYQPIRDTNTPIGVGVDWLGSTIKETTGLKLENGQFKTSGSASIRDAKDVRALQNLYDTYKPLFQRGALTSSEFLNLRTDLGKLSKFEREFTKSAPLENLTKVIRGKLNTAYRIKIPGLDTLDTQFQKQITEINNLQKGVLDKSGNLTDTAINRIANAGNKEILLNKLEQLVPGITGKIKTLKAIEDIKSASGQKVGTYARAGGLIAGATTLNPYLIMGSILSIPEVAVPILRGIGMAEPVITSTLKNLGIVGNQVNNLPTSATDLLKKNVLDIKPKIGLTIQDVSGNQGINAKSTITENNPITNSLKTKGISKVSETKPNAQGNQGMANSHSSNSTTIPKELQSLVQEARKYKTAEEFVNSPRYEYHLSNEANLAEGKTFAEQTTKQTSRNRGFGNTAEDGIYSTNSPQFWATQLEADLGKKAPQNVYLVEVKNPSPRGMLESGFDAQAVNAPQDVRIIKKLGTAKDLQDMGRIESIKKSQLTDIWNKAHKK